MHFEFYVLWSDRSWSVEAIDFSTSWVPAEEMIATARADLTEKLVAQERRIELVGLLFAMEKRNAAEREEE